MHRRLTSALRWGLLILLIVSLVFPPQSSSFAAAILTVTPITWNIIGLDSNNVNVGPNEFPIGARVCNTGDTAATNVTASFVWDSANANINLRPGTNSTLSLASLAAGTCTTTFTDFYFEVEVTRTSAAYDTTRNYHITVTADGGISASSPTPRQLYVEHLVSQNRNAVTDVRFGTTLAALDLPASSVPAGGTMNLMVGNTYYIRMIGFTATQGYEQLESFINIPNTIFQVLSVSTTYTADSSAYVSSPNNKLYGDACKWENDPNSPNYRSCLDVGKVGGDITVTYQVKILKVPSAPLGNPQPLSTLIYDFSGSSFHYNSDFGVSTRYANIINASSNKSFSPKTILPGGTSTLTFTITNPGTSSISNLNFTDDLPNNLSLSNTNVAYSGCGASPSPSTVSDPMSFSNITIAANSICTITVTVTSSTAGTYTNTTGSLFIDITDTGSIASDTLVVSSQPSPPSSCTTPTTFATWTMPTSGQGSGGPPPPYTTKASNVTTATASSSGGTFTIAVDGSTAANSWSGSGWPSTGTPGPTTTPYFEFVLDTSKYGGVTINFDYLLTTNGDWAASSNNLIYIHTRADSGSFTSSTGFSTSKGTWQTTTAGTYGITYAVPTTGTSTTTFRINAVGAQNTSAQFHIDDVTFTGCTLPNVPNLSKSFSPTSIGTGTTSTLTFTLTNPNSTSSLTGVSFSDVLPSGLTVLSASSSACSGGTLTVTAPRSISLSNGTLAASGTCTINVTVTGAVAGSYANVSSSVSSTETGPNTASNGIGTATLTVINPPVIAKSFTANPIFTGNTTTLSFTINNPNGSTILNGVSFTDSLPLGLIIATPSNLSNSCGGTAAAVESSSNVSLSGVSLAAAASCAVTVNVTGSAAGLKNNSVTASSTNGGTGNTSTASVLVKDPAPAISLLKQVGPTSSGPWSSFLGISTGGNVFYRLIVENVGDVPLNSVSVSDPDVSPASCSWVDGDGTPLTAPFSLPVADVNDDQIAVCVLGPIVAVSGSHPNIATASGTNGSTVSDSSTATYGTPALTLVKSAVQPSFTSAGDILNFNYLVTNSGFAPLLGPVTVSDDKTTVSCPAVGTIGDNDGYLEVSESLTCTASYTVTISDVAAGFVTNTASATASGVTSNTSAKTVTVAPDLTVAKTDNTSGNLVLGNSFNWTIAVNNSIGMATFTDTQVILRDTLPGLAADYPQGTLTVTNGSTAPTGIINCSISGTTLACVASGTVTLPAGSSFSITFAVTPSAAGNLLNTATVDPNGVVSENNEANNTGSNTVVVAAPASTATDTPTNTPTSTPTSTPTDTPTSTPTDTPTNTPTDTPTSTPTNTLTDTPTSTPTDTPTNTPTDTPTSTPTSTATDTPTNTPTDTPTSTSTVTPTSTPSNTPTDTPTSTPTDIPTSTPTDTPTDIPTDTPTSTPTETPTSTPTGTQTSTPTNTPTGTPNPSVQVADPALAKSGSPTSASVGETITFTLVVTNRGNSPAPNVVVTDALPMIFDVTAVHVSGAPLGTLVNVTPAIGIGTAPFTVIVTLGGSLGVTDVVTIQIVTRVNSQGNPPINNTAKLTTSATSDVISNDSASVAINIRNTRTAANLPATGFAKGVKTFLEPQPSNLKYLATDLFLEIPSLRVKIPITGVPKKNGTWNISWLSDQAGWLEESAFPSWSGNSVLTGHVYLASGLPGPFVNLNKLKYGDKIVIYAYGQKYIFEVQTNSVLTANDSSVMKHEEKSWLTLVTCKDYDENTKTYKNRVVVRAVLVKVEWE